MIYNIRVILYLEVSAMKRTLKRVVCCLLSCLMIFASSAAAFAADESVTPVIVVNDMKYNPLVSSDDDSVVFDFTKLELPSYFTKPFTEDIYTVFSAESIKSYVGEDGSFDILAAAMSILGAVNVTADVLDLVAKVTPIYEELSKIVDFKNLKDTDPELIKEFIDKYKDEFTAKKEAFIASVKAIAPNADGTPADDSVTAGYYPKSVDNYSYDDLFELRTSELVTGVSEKVGEENTYLFLYDFRLNPVENAKKFNDFVKNVKNESGADKVNVISEGYGSLITTTYFSEFAAGDVKNFVTVSSEFSGTSIFGDIYSGNLMNNAKSDLNVRTSAMVRYINDYSDNPITFGIGWLVSYILNREWELQSFTYDYSEIVQEYANKYVYGEFADLFKNAPGLWALVPADKYDDSVKFMFGDKSKADSSLIAKLDKFKEIQKNAKDIIIDTKNTGVNVSVVALWDMQLLPVGETCSVQSDGWVDTAYASYGASCIDLNSLSEATEVTQATDNNHDHLSDTFKAQDPRFTIAGIGHFIDASVCALPENTWFIANMKHNTFNSASNSMEFLMWLLTSETERTVWDNASFPQFLKMDRYIGTGGKLNIYDGYDAEPGSYLLGDIDLDGKVTAYDALLAQRIASGELNFEEGSLPLKNADVNGDGEITQEDADLILNISAGLEKDYTSGVDTSIPEKNTEMLRESNASIRTQALFNNANNTLTLNLYLVNPQPDSTANIAVNYNSSLFDFKSVKVKIAKSGDITAGKPENIDGVVTCAYKFPEDIDSEDYDSDNEMLLASYTFNVLGAKDDTSIKAGVTFMTESGEKVYCPSVQNDFKKSDFMLLGDVNGDGNITSFDARYVLRVAAKLEVIPDDLIRIADVNHDGKVTAIDARIILRVAARLQEFDDSDDSGNIIISDSLKIEEIKE